MKDLALDDYHGDGEGSGGAIKFCFGHGTERENKGTLDGVRMIEKFVTPNRMTQWSLTKGTKKRREGAIK